MRKRLLLLTTVIVLVALGPHRQPLAQTVPQPAIQVPLQDLPADSAFGNRIGRWFGALRQAIGLSPRVLDVANRYSSDSVRTDDFNWLMGIAGYRLKTIESSVSLLPGLTLEFGMARQLSEADHEFLERALERHAERNPGTLAAIQRMILHGIAEANSIVGFSVEKINVTLLPLPFVKFTLTQSDAPFGQESSRIMRAIEQLNHRLQQSTAPHSGGNQLDIPPPPMLRPAADLL
jgi:hypothetical protein